MDPANTPKHMARILRICLILLSLSAFTVLLMGNSMVKTHNEVKELKQFMELAHDVQPNFEKSLTLYTENTKPEMNYVQKLRPNSELKYIAFISSVEEIGQQLSLNLELSSIDASKINVDASGSKTLDYQVQFYGSLQNLTEFLRQVEKLDYFVKIDSFNFRTINGNAENLSSPNISLIMRLYVK